MASSLGFLEDASSSGWRQWTLAPTLLEVPMIPLPWRLLQAIQWLLKQANKKDWSLIGSARQKGFHFLFYMPLPAQRFFPSFPSYKDVISLPLCLKIRFSAFNVVLEEGVRFWNVFSSSNIACFTWIIKWMWTLIILKGKSEYGRSDHQYEFLSRRKGGWN